LSYKGIAAQPSVAGGLGKALSQFMGAYMGGKAEEDLATAKAKEDKTVNDIYTKLFSKTPDVTQAEYYLPPNQKDSADIGQYVPAKTTPGRSLTNEEQMAVRLPQISEHRGLKDLGSAFLSNAMTQRSADIERQRVADQEKTLTKPANVSDAAWTSAGNVPGMRTDLFKSNSVAKHGDYYQELVDAGLTPGTPAFSQAMADKRRKETYIAPVTPPAPGMPQSYVIDGKQVFTTPQDALLRAQKGSAVIPAADAKPKTPAAKTVDQLKNEQLYNVVTPELKTLTKNWGELGKKQNQFFAGVGEAKIPFTDIGIPKGSVTGTEYQLAETSLSVIAASYIYSVSGATASPDEVKKTVSALMPAFGEGEEQKKAKLDRIKTMVQAIGERAKGGFNEAPPSNSSSPPISSLQEGKQTTFENGQVWTLQNNVPVRVR
jgi:hypothetical protein